MTAYLKRLVASRERLIMAAIAAVAVAAMLLGLGQKVVEGYESLASADRLATIAQLLSGPPKRPVPVTFLDVDDKTREAWRATSDTPHGALARLIELASLGVGADKARAIIVDFDLSRASDQPGDADLTHTLASYPADAPPLLIVRRIKVIGEDGKEKASAATTPYDDAVKGKANVQWITGLNDIGADRSVRRIRLWQSVCDGDGAVYPSAALVVAAIAGGHGGALADFLAQRKAVDCNDTQPEAEGWPPVTERAVTLPYLFGDARGPAALRISPADGGSVALRRISAGLLVQGQDTKFDAAKDVDRDPFTGRVIIIGASFADSGDIHRTPMGAMPGALIIANSVVQAKALTSGGTSPAWLRNLLAALLFLVLVWFVRTLFGAVAVIVIGIVCLDVLWVASKLFGFATGVEVVAVALSTLALYKLIDSLITIAAKFPKLGWRAMLKH